jgi:hypothetical protein
LEFLISGTDFAFLYIGNRKILQIEKDKQGYRKTEKGGALWHCYLFIEDIETV